MMRNGTAYRLQNLARPTTEIECGLSLIPKIHAKKREAQCVEMESGGVKPAITQSSEGACAITESGSAMIAENGHTRFITTLTMGANSAGLVTCPTPAAHEARLGYQRRGEGKKGSQISLTTFLINLEGGREIVIGSLNPCWLDWLMGFPQGHTDLNA
jgi:hypothetical protein